MKEKGRGGEKDNVKLCKKIEILMSGFVVNSFSIGGKVLAGGGGSMTS